MLKSIFTGIFQNSPEIQKNNYLTSDDRYNSYLINDVGLGKKIRELDMRSQVALSKQKTLLRYIQVKKAVYNFAFNRYKEMHSLFSNTAGLSIDEGIELTKSLHDMYIQSYMKPINDLYRISFDLDLSKVQGLPEDEVPTAIDLPESTQGNEENTDDDDDKKHNFSNLPLVVYLMKNQFQRLLQIIQT